MIDIKKVELPSSPGVYKFINKESNIIYVGKSKSLNKRVKSYFQKQNNNKILKMIKEITKIDFVISESEHDALLLENNLIKEYKPKYNILLRDDKTYPWVSIKKERFPRVFLTRKYIKDGSEYFGPFTNVKAINSLLNIINNIYPIRVSNYNFSQKKINDLKNNIGLNVHSKNGHTLILGFTKYGKKNKKLLSEKAYNENIKYVREILKGNFKNVKEHLINKMKEFSELLEFEKSQNIKEKLKLLDTYQSKSIIVNDKYNALDVIGMIEDGKSYFINYLKINNGMIIGSESLKIKKKLSLEKKELRQIIMDLKFKYNSVNNNIISNINLNKIISNDLKSYIPKAGDKKKLLDMSLKNILFFKKNLYNEKKERKTKKLSILLDLKNKLNLKKIPFHIECFDISNIQGENTVASMVLFKDGYPNKREYRKYKIRSVTKPDDFESMREVVLRRYSKLIKENNSLPDLIIIDGGKGQLSSACQVLKDLKIYNKINVIGIAKKLEEIYFPNDSIPILLGKNTQELKFIQNIRNEAHRFAITYHKQLRSNTFIQSELEEIFGIGEITRTKLIKNFGSIENIKKASKKKLSRIIGKEKAEKIINYFTSTPKD